MNRALIRRLRSTIAPSAVFTTKVTACFIPAAFSLVALFSVEWGLWRGRYCVLGHGARIWAGRSVKTWYGVVPDAEPDTFATLQLSESEIPETGWPQWRRGNNIIMVAVPAWT